MGPIDGLGLAAREGTGAQTLLLGREHADPIVARLAVLLAG
jgi:hypothetical protein